MLSLTACAKQTDAGANATADEAAINADTLGNDDTFASDNVVLPEDNLTDANATDPTNSTGNTN